MHTMDKEQYKGIQVFAEQREGVVQNVAFELIGKARELEKRLQLFFSDRM